MAANPHYLHHVQTTLGRVPGLVCQWMDQTLATLRSSNTDLKLAHDRNLLFQVMETLQRQRTMLEARLAFHIQAGVESTERAGTSPHSLSDLKLEELTLVDESEAEKEIEVSRTVQLIDLKAEWEWKELQAFSATLQGEKNLRPEANPFRPAVFANALSQSTAELDLSGEARNLLLRMGAKTLAEVLRTFYTETCDAIRQQGFEPLAYQAVTAPRKPKTSDVNVTQPGALTSLLNRIPAQQLMAKGMPATMVSTSLDHALHHLQSAPHAMAPAPKPAQSDPQTMALLARIFEQMVKDEELQPSVKNVIGRLQPSVLRAAVHDPRVARTDQHPAWRLLNEVASYANGYSEQDQHIGLSSFLRFLEPLIHQLAHHPAPQAAHYDAALQQVQGFIEEQSHHELQPSKQAVTELEVADQRQALKPILKQQISHQLAATKVSDRIREFLSGPWVDVLAHTMATFGHDDQEAQDMLATVDDLLQSLQRPATPQERDALRRTLPGLIQRVQKGMAMIDLPQGQREAILDEMMIIHTKFLRAQPKPKAEPTPEELVRQMQDEMDAPDDEPFEHALRKQVLDTNVGSLPTVPMSFGDDAQNSGTDTSASEWIDSLQKGSWCKLFMQGKWTSAHLLWFSGNRQFFIFSSDHAGRMHSLTRRALERLRAEGLATSLEDRNLMQRAVDSLLQDLGD